MRQRKAPYLARSSAMPRDRSEPGRVRRAESSKRPIPTSIEESATLKTQTNPSFDALKKSITAPNRIRSMAFPMAPAMMKASPTVLTRDVGRRTTTRTRTAATARFNATRPQRVSSPDTGTRPNALLRLNTRVRSTGPGTTKLEPACRSAASAHCFDNWSRPSTTAATKSAITRRFWHLLTSETS
jgi:hypothetical protein